jgi:ferredoxin
MKFKIKSELCRGCGVCEAVCPTVYKMNNSRIAEIVTASVSGELKDCAIQGENICPMGAIIHE